MNTTERLRRKFAEADRKSAERFWANLQPLPDRYDMSDRGAGVRAMVREIDSRFCSTWKQREHAAKVYAARHCNSTEQKVLALVIKNGKNRRESIWELKRGLEQRKKSTSVVSSGSTANSTGSAGTKGGQNDNR